MTNVRRSTVSPAASQRPTVVESAPGSAETASQNLLLACAAECIGTLLLVLVGTAVATAAIPSKATAGPAYDSLAVALSFGLILIPIAGSLGQISGAHVNPAVTLGLAVAGKFSWKNVIPYWGAQMVGAVVGLPARLGRLWPWRLCPGPSWTSLSSQWSKPAAGAPG